MKHENKSESNETRILKNAHKLYKNCIKRFELEYWHEMLKVLPKWKKICFSTQIASCEKRSNLDIEEASDEGVGGVSGLRDKSCKEEGQTKS